MLAWEVAQIREQKPGSELHVRRVFTEDCAEGAGYRRMHHYIIKVFEDNLGW